MAKASWHLPLGNRWQAVADRTLAPIAERLRTAEIREEIANLLLT